MKILQKEVQVLYRFRCERCRSQFEMTEEEKTENDWKFTDPEGSHERNNREKYTFPHNPLDHFDCPVCKCVRYVCRGDMHRFHVMDNGYEVRDY